MAPCFYLRILFFWSGLFVCASVANHDELLLQSVWPLSRFLHVVLCCRSLFFLPSFFVSLSHSFSLSRALSPSLPLLVVPMPFFKNRLQDKAHLLLLVEAQHL